MRKNVSQLIRGIGDSAAEPVDVLDCFRAGSCPRVNGLVMASYGKERQHSVRPDGIFIEQQVRTIDVREMLDLLRQEA